ncbi:MAG: RAMP superfamily CRISPR-associated protein, partial [Candidatus Methanomethylicia archaeon]
RYLRGEISEDEIINIIYNQYRGVEIRPSRRMPRYLDKIIIPGSSIKGAIRSRIEYKCSPSISCYSVESRELPPKQFYRRHIGYWGENVVDARGACSPDNVCIVCDLFGAPGLLSRVYFTDMVMSSGGVSFLKDLGVEAVNPNSKFNLEVNGVNFNFTDLGLMLAGLEIFTGSRVPICAYKYRYNPNLGGGHYMDKYVFGLVKFSINGFRENISRKLSDLKLEDLISRSREELTNTLGDNIDIRKGVI